MMALANWRTALFSAVLIAAIQDPFRKLIPGAPGYLTLSTMVIFLVGVVALASRRPGWLKKIGQFYPRLGRATRILVIALIPAAFLSLTYGAGTWRYTLLGIAAYTSPILAVAMGFHFARNGKDIRKLLAFYCVASAIMLVGTFIQYYDFWPGSAIVGTDALEMSWIRHKDGFIVQLIAGFYRSPDVMGWHSVATSMLALVLAITSRGINRMTWLAAAVYALFPLMLSGRRKMLYMLPIFIVTLTWILWNCRNSGKKHFSVLTLAVALSGLFSAFAWLGEDSSYVRYYLENATTDTTEQLQKHAIESLYTTYYQSGFFGSGLGFASPGSHHLGGDRPRAWQESGPSRVLVELGVPGIAALIGLLITLMQVVWQKIKANVTRPRYMNEYSAGLFAFTVANLGSLVVSGQILADSFVAIFIGLMTGMSLSALRFTVTRPIENSTAMLSTDSPRIQPVS
jgi:hypothetical protein